MDRHHRINSLPDEIICFILSFLSTKEAALTSVLSKRWRNLFAFTTNLDFDDHDYRNPDNYAIFSDVDDYDYQNPDFYVSFSDFENYDYWNHDNNTSFRDYDDYEYRNPDNYVRLSDFDNYDYRNHENDTSFRDFLDRVLAVSSNSPLNKFTLRYQKSVDAALINRWICNVLSRGVLDLHLDAITKDVITLPLEIFTCKTIVKLKLGGGFGIMVPENASLPALKTLYLGCNQLSSHRGSAFEDLISACHVLEELTIHVYASAQWQQFGTISCPTLEKLTIFCNLWSRFDVSHSITFDTPSLTYLDYTKHT